MNFRRQSDPSGARKSKGPSYFTFSPGDQAVGHSGFDKLLRWAEIDFPSNPVYADPNALPQLRLPDTVVEEKLVEHFQRQHLSSRAPSRLNMGRVHAASAATRHQPNHHEPLTAPMKPQIDTTSPSNIKGRRPAARKSLERQWIAVAQQYATLAAQQQQQQQLQLHYHQQRQQLAAGAPATSSSAPSSVPVSAMSGAQQLHHQHHHAAMPGATAGGVSASTASQTAAFVPQKFSV